MGKLDDAFAPEPDDVLSVAALTDRIKALLEGQVPPCWVRGEISNLRKQSSGHVYFTLKDRDSQLPAVIFKGDAMRCSVDLRDGVQIILFGSLSVYAPHGRYQFIGREVVEDGAGRLQAEFERLKKKLAAEGLFDRERKKSLPKLPRTVGIITSPTGAALRDFISILKRRHWRGRVIILPAKVQGQGAAQDIVRQIEAAQALGCIDLLVAGRGGGSLEDLWCFNEEIVARALAACSIPTISAVGHEIDFTLSDFAADQRAETPSAAAELISSAYLDCLDRLRDCAKALREVPEWLLERHGNRLHLIASRMREHSPQRRIDEAGLKLDDLTQRLGHSLRENLHDRREALAGLNRRLQENAPLRRLELAEVKLDALQKRFARQLITGLQPKVEALAHLQARLETASLPRALARGFAIVRDAQGNLITRGEALRSGDAIAVDFADGEVHAEVTRTQHGN